jgi:hypothetical protein
MNMFWMARLLLFLCATARLLLHCQVPVSLAAQPGSTTDAARRGFLMGFTSWPYAATSEAVRETYAFIGRNADLVVEHMDDGVPWTESLRDAPYAKDFSKGSRVGGRTGRQG